MSVRGTRLVGLMVAAVIATLGPATVASGGVVGPIVYSNTDGRLFDLTVSTYENITASDPAREATDQDGLRYTWVEWKLQNKSGTTLTHPEITVTLADFCGATLCTTGGSDPQPKQTAAFLLPDSSNACGALNGSSSALQCIYANLAAGAYTGGGPTGTPTRIYFRTADVPATHTTITLKVTVKERASDANGCAVGDPNCDTLITDPPLTNSYEPDDDAGYTFVPVNGKQFHLATNDERSSFDFKSAGTFFRVDFSTDTSACTVVTLTCFERFLDVTAVDAPAAYNNGPVVFYARLTNPPSGVNANNVVAIHTYDNPLTPPLVIGDQDEERSKKGCTWTFSTEIPVPSICAKKVQGLPQALDVWVWDVGNGRVGYG